jgi:hypothetical protein
VTLNYVRCALCLFFGAAVSSAASLPVGPPPILIAAPVTAVVLPGARYSKVAIREMVRESAHILKQSGVSLRWQVGAPDQAVMGRLVVVKLVGRCDMDGSPPLVVSGPLGWSHKVNGSILPFSDLACDTIRGAVQTAIADGNHLRANILLGRAMGRVLAHELYHIVADTSEHGRGGVAQRALSPRQLTSPQLELEPSDVAAVQNGLNQSTVNQAAVRQLGISQAR